MARFEFEAEIVHWRGPAPFYFARLPQGVAEAISALAKQVSYGWGAVPVVAEIDGVGFSTSLFPREGSYLLPLKDAVRRKIRVPEDGPISVVMHVGRDRGAEGARDQKA